MRPSLAAALAAAVILALPAPAQAAAPTVIDASGQSAVTVDIGQANKTLEFRLDEREFIDDLDAASVRLHTLGEPTLELALQRTGDLWSATLPVSTPDLVKGSWTATFSGTKAGSSGDLATVALQLTTSDSVAPTLKLAQPAQTVVLGPLDSVALNVSDPLLRKVTYTFGGIPDGLPLAFPYVLRGDLLPQGLTTVVFQAFDRAGHSNTLSVPVDRDAIVPHVGLQRPEHAYAGAPLSLLTLVREDGPHTLRLLSNGTMVSEVKIPGYASAETNRTFTFTLPASPLGSTGNVSLLVEAVDRAGSRALAGLEMPLEPPVVDAKAVSLRVEGNGSGVPLYARDVVRLNATVSQVGGVAVLPLTVATEVAGRSNTTVVDVGPGQSRTTTWASKLPAGRHTVRAVVSAPPSANETAPGNEEATLEIEVFLGLLAEDGKRYNIRASDSGLPTTAVESGSTKAYPLKLVDSGPGVAYQFTTSANRTYVWDPLKPYDDRDAGTNATSGPSSGTDGGRGAPSPGLAPALLVVALAAALRRRR